MFEGADLPRLLLAEEAIALEAGRRYPSYDDHWPDWHASGLFLMARVQLDQMVEVLSGVFGDVSNLKTGVLPVLIRARYAASSLEWSDLREFEVDALDEALELRRFLPGALVADVGKAVDGSPSMAIGPDLPGFETIGIPANGGEYTDNAAAVLNIAQIATRSAAAMVADLRYGREAN